MPRTTQPAGAGLPGWGASWVRARAKAGAVVPQAQPGAPGPGSQRTGLRSWGGGPSHLGAWENETLNF